MRVDLNSGETDIYAEFEHDGAHWILADENGVYLSCSLYNDKNCCLYKLTDTETKLLSENMVNFPKFRNITIGENGLFFAEKSDTESGEHLLKRYDTKTEEISIIAQTDSDVQLGRLDYSNGYVYNAYGSFYRINTENGEIEYIGKGTEYGVHDGRLYYANYGFGGINPTILEVMRRNPDSNLIDRYGKLDMPHLTAIGFANSIEFGENGFIIYCTERGKRTKYMYFKYGKYGGKFLTQKTDTTS